MPADRLDITYEIVAESVASELIEDEVIIVHFDSGNYFSLRGAAYKAWGLMINDSVMPSSLISSINADEPSARAQMQRFVEALTSEEIIRPSPAQPSENFSSDGLVLQELVVEKYEDMQLLLLGDPIHEVEDEGWPTMREDGAQ